MVKATLSPIKLIDYIKIEGICLYPLKICYNSEAKL